MIISDNEHLKKAFADLIDENEEEAKVSFRKQIIEYVAIHKAKEMVQKSGG